MSLHTRVGLIGSDDNRFLGRSVFTELSAELGDLGHAIGLAVGARVADADDREALRLIALCTTSPDARVWPLKLCRLMSSYGDPVAGFYGSQLVCASRMMGPGAAGAAAAGLCFVAEHEPSLGVDLAVARWLAANRDRFGGFGVPFRPEDERLVAMRRFVAGTALEQRRYWRLSEQVAAAVARRGATRPNVGLGVGALLLDLGVRPERCGLALALLMAHIFAAHAVEASETDGAALHQLPPGVVDYVGVAPRAVRPADPGSAG